MDSPPTRTEYRLVISHPKLDDDVRVLRDEDYARKLAARWEGRTTPWGATGRVERRIVTKWEPVEP